VRLCVKFKDLITHLFPHKMQVIRGHKLPLPDQRHKSGQGQEQPSQRVPPPQRAQPTRKIQLPERTVETPSQMSPAAGFVTFKERGTTDEVNVLLDGLAMRLARDIRFDLPFEVTVVVPRAEVTRKYQDGNLVETNLVYSGITISHSPRYPPRK